MLTNVTIHGTFQNSCHVPIYVYRERERERERQTQTDIQIHIYRIHVTNQERFLR
jgi:hypothetical protein